MKYKFNTITLHLIFLLLSFSYIFSIPQCELKLTCKKECISNLVKLIDGKTGSENTISLVVDTTQTIQDPNDSAKYYTQYTTYNPKTFDCQPGDKIVFNINPKDPTDINTDEFKVGFISVLTITGSDGNNKIYNFYDSLNEVLSCIQSCSLSTNDKLVFNSESTEHKILGNSNYYPIKVTISIPYKIKAIQEPQPINNANTPQNFYFQNYIEPEISGTDLSRIQVKMDEIANNDCFNLYKNDNQNDILSVGNFIFLTDKITFSHKNDNYGLFELKYKVKVMSEELTERHSIKFNVCYKFCHTCNTYNSINTPEKKCTSCITGSSYFIEDQENDRCFSLAEISNNFQNYYEDTSVTPIYKKCANFCLTCQSFSDNCLSCVKTFYKVEGLSDGNPSKCFSPEEFNTQENYYLPTPNGDKYFRCQSPCKSCRLNENNCFSCVDGTFFYSNDINKCQSEISNPSFFKIEDTFLEKDKSCNSIISDNNKKKCATCSSGPINYYKYENDENFCYLSQEIFSKFGINNFLDTNDGIYKICNEGCLLCSGSNNNCLKCKNRYYFIESSSFSDSQCRTKSQIDELSGHYYLPKESDIYYQCDANCICSLKKDNCTSCDNGYKLIDNEHKCINTELPGYYLYQNSIYKKCHNSCLTCNGEGPDKCLSCSKPYYLIDLHNGIQRCITQIEKKENQIYNNYYLKEDNGNYYYKNCDTSCASCDDINPGNMCIKCNSRYSFYEDGGQICFEIITFFDSSLLNGNNPENYYYNTKLKEFRLCHNSCQSCKDGEVYNNCYQCSTGYAFIDDPSTGKCVLETLFSSKNYYKVENVITKLRDETSIQVKVYKKCPENCEKCISYQDNPLKCEICNNDRGYYKHTNTIDDSQQEECYDNFLVEHKFFNGNGYSLSISECLISTFETEEKKSCIKCHNKLGYYSLENAPETCQNIIPIDHYISSDNIIKKCPYECAACSEGPTSESTNCDVCKEEFSPSISNPKNCIFKCDYYVYKFYDNKYCTGEKECPDLAKFLYKENSTCVNKCEKVSYYGICLDECPPKTYKSGNECKDYANTCTLSKFEEIREHLIDLKNDNAPILKKVKKYKKYFYDTPYHIDMYTHYLNEYVMLIYQKSDCINQLLPDLISVDFTPCFYPERNYISVLFLVPRDNKYSKIYYQLYEIDNSGNLIDINTNFACSNQIKVQIPATQAKFGYDKYQRLYNEGIRLDNYLENFFYDMCFQNYEDGKDIIIKQRRREYYQDPCKVCLDNCTFDIPPNNYERALCLCSYKNNFLEELYQEYVDLNKYCVMSEEFYKTEIYIFEHFKCFKYNFENGNIFENMGNYMMIVFIILEIISVVIYLVFGIDSIKIYIIDFIKRNPPKKIKISTGSEDELNNENNNIDIKSNSNNTSSNNKKHKKRSQIISNNYIGNEQRTLNSNNKKLKRWEQPDLLIGRSNNLGNSEFKDKYIKIYERYTKKETENNNKNDNLKESPENKNNSVLFKSTIKLKTQPNDKNNDFKKHSHVFTNYELNSMELYDALIKDKRDFCYFYKLQMKSKQEFYRAFCINEPLYPISIKIFVYIFNLSLNLNFNALLYTEEQIYEGVRSMGKNIGNIFLRAFYTFLIVKVIDYVISLFIKNSNYLRSLVLRRKREKELRIDAYKNLKNIQNNFCFFIVFVFICDVLFWIFIVSYCYSYNGEQLELFGAFLVTQFYMEIYCILFGLYLAVFRFIGMKYKATTCYKMSQTFLDT